VTVCVRFGQNHVHSIITNYLEEVMSHEES
jgi:hypothetical protein